jgi:hypothetical protein
MIKQGNPAETFGQAGMEGILSKQFLLTGLLEHLLLNKFPGRNYIEHTTGVSSFTVLHQR